MSEELLTEEQWRERNRARSKRYSAAVRILRAHWAEFPDAISTEKMHADGFEFWNHHGPSCSRCFRSKMWFKTVPEHNLLLWLCRACGHREWEGAV